MAQLHLVAETEVFFINLGDWAADQGSPVGLQPTENNGLEFARHFRGFRDRSPHWGGSLHVLTIRRYR